jgi:phytoene dehydrogenase-like protein
MATGRPPVVVVGSGPNGLAAAIRLAAAGADVLVLEAEEFIGGGTRSEALTLPGFVHDVCSAVHPFGVASPYLASLPLEEHGLRWVHPDAPLTHPLDDGPAVALERATVDTDAMLDATDAGAWSRAFDPLVAGWPELRARLLSPILRVPRHPITLARFGLNALRSAEGFASARFEGDRARALFAGIAAHSFLELDHPTSAGFGLALAVSGHAVGWPIARGGSQTIADALVGHLTVLGGEIRTRTPVEDLADIPEPVSAVVLDVAPRQAMAIAGARLGRRDRGRVRRFRRGPGVFKVDYALSAPVPWRAEGTERGGTVHLGGTMIEMAAAEADVVAGRHPEHPYVLVSQPTVTDPSRAPEGQHILWAYCHVPHGSPVDMTPAIERQLERFAPGFSDVVIQRHTMGPADLERRNRNCVGGDISGGAHDGLQLIARPWLTLDPYRLEPPSDAQPGLYLCSSSTPPGAGVHGMCGYHAAGSVIRDLGLED